jgi:site-specific DNA-methyltransferase (adenine-specific)
MTQPYYDHGGITIYHGDCREVLPLDADLVLTDPPYGIAWQQHGGGKTGKSRGMRKHAPIIGDGDVALRDEVLTRLADKPAAVFGSFRAPFPPGVIQVLIYRKTPDAGLVGSVTGFRTDVEPIFLVGPWPTARKPHSSAVLASRIGLQILAAPGLHPHAKPADVLGKLLHAMPAGTVLDPFMGSGTTLRAAKDLGRKAIGIEIEERYCEIAARRLEQEVLDFGAGAIPQPDAGVPLRGRCGVCGQAR